MAFRGLGGFCQDLGNELVQHEVRFELGGDESLVGFEAGFQCVLELSDAETIRYLGGEEKRVGRDAAVLLAREMGGF